MLTTPKKPMIQQLQRMFNGINKGIFGGVLREPVMTYQPEKKVVLRFTEHGYMVIGSEFATATMAEIEEAMMHEMVHIKNHHDGTLDCTSNKYHNRKFLDSALEAGLIVIRHKTQGWGVTKFEVNGRFDDDDVTYPSPDDAAHLKKVIASLSYDPEPIKKMQKHMRKYLKANPKKRCFLKYECGCKPPHNSIRSGRRPDGGNPINAICKDCGKPFRCVDEFVMVSKPEKKVAALV